MSTDGPHRFDIAIEADAWHAAIDESVIARAAEAALTAACPALGEATISLLLTDDAAVRTLNKQWRGKDTPTNVLSFPATQIRAGETPRPEFAGVPLELGDIALGFETCHREAAAEGKPLDHHIAHLVVHGVLHLLGHDHIEDTDAARMEGLEVVILQGLGVPDPYSVERPGHA
jgi:probable rRNA maturation factor